MRRYEAELWTMLAVEQQLLNAAVSLRSTEHRLGDGQLWEEIRSILRSVETTVAHTKRVKRIILDEWQSAEAEANKSAA
jgi:hypothetical protein